MQDVSVVLEPRPGSLADFSETLGAAGISLEGGGVFTVGGVAVAHFLVAGAEGARTALESAGIRPVTISDVVTLRLDQERPGQLGAFSRRLADAGIDIRVQYSDHDHRLVLVVDPHRQAEAARIAAQWDVDRRS
jgi:hypothetical protein